MNVLMVNGRVISKVTLSPNSKTPYVYFTLAVPRHYAYKQAIANNEYVKCDLIVCKAFGSTAENIHKYVIQGDEITIKGQFRNDAPFEFQGHKIVRSHLYIEEWRVFKKVKREKKQVEQPQPYDFGVDENIDF